MAVPGLQKVLDEGRAARREAKRAAKVPLPAVSRVKTPAVTDETQHLDTLFRKRLYGVLEAHLPRFEALLDSPDDKIARETWETAFKYGLMPRQAGFSGGGGQAGTKIVFNFPDGDAPIDVTPNA